MMISGASASPFGVAAAALPAIADTAASLVLLSCPPPLLGVLLELVRPPRVRGWMTRGGVVDGSAARIASSSFRMSANVGLTGGWVKVVGKWMSRKVSCE